MRSISIVMASSIAWPLHAKVCGRLRTRMLPSAEDLRQYSRSRSDGENSLAAYRNRSGLSDCAALHAPLRRGAAFAAISAVYQAIRAGAVEAACRAR